MRMMRSAAADLLIRARENAGEGGSGSSGNGCGARMEAGELWLSPTLAGEIFGCSANEILRGAAVLAAEGEIKAEDAARTFSNSYPAEAAAGASEARFVSLSAVIALGLRLKGERAAAFRRWAGQALGSVMAKGWALDGKRLRRGRIFGDDYFEEVLEEIEEIRQSARRSDQRATDLFATAADYDAASPAVRRFYGTVAERLRALGRGALERSGRREEGAGMTLADVLTPGRCLSDETLEAFRRQVEAYLDLAEAQAKRRAPMMKADWEKRMAGFLVLAE